MNCNVVIVISLCLAITGCSGTSKNPDYIAGINDGMPFGEITDANGDELMKFAQSKGVDIGADLQKAYEKNLESLSPVFEFSLNFSTLDKNARTYAQGIWSALLNLGETMGTKQFAEELSKQKPDVQQRIRDILYYPVVHLPKTMSERKKSEDAVRSDEPDLFPADYHFGRDDPVFR
jgi:hypothetical protein